MEISSGGYNIIQTGQVMAYAMEPIEFKFADNFIIRIKVTKNSDKDPSINSEIIDNKILELEFVNPHILLNFGTSEPFSIGTLNNKPAFANFRINTISDSNQNYSSFIVTYSFYN